MENSTNTEQQYLKAQPEKMPQPTYMPFFLAVSLLFLAWGLLSTWIIAVAGGVGTCISLIGWIKHMLHESEQNEQA
ncbi:MAG: hypothetical protein ACO1OO_10560 [Flavisolibacter sp.]